MKLLKTIILPFLSRVCVTSVAVTYFFFFFVQALSNDMRGISFLQYLYLFIFSLTLAATFYIFRAPIAKALRVVLHFVASAFSFFAIFSLTGNLSFKTTAQLFVAIALFTLVYAIIGGVFLLARALLRRFSKGGDESGAKDEKKKEKPVYEKRF